MTSSRGGVSCDGCERGADFDRFEYYDGETNIENAMMSQSFGYITLRPEEGSDDWLFDYVTPDRDGSGVATNSFIDRAVLVP